MKLSRSSWLVAAGCAGIAAIAPSALAVEAQPLPRRDGVVVAWQARTATAVVVTGDRRVYAVHALRRVTPGTRVRVDGIKWGRPTAGIKWSVAPQGIKWGIKWAKNGTYQSRLTRTGTATTTSLRGTVIRRFPRAVAVSVRGATIVIPTTRGAVWLPGGKVQNATTELGRLGATVDVRVGFTSTGRAVARGVTEIAPPIPSARIPLAGKIVAVDPVARAITVRSGTVAFPLDLIVEVPAAFDLGLYPVGSQIAGRIAEAPAPQQTLHAVELSLNGSFAQADSPVTSVSSPPADPAHVAAATSLKDRWLAARAGGWIPNDGLFTANLNRLERLGFLIVVSDKEKAVKEIDQFVMKLQSGGPAAIDPGFKTEAEAAAAALKAQLGG
jgi:hypothetical protein